MSNNSTAAVSLAVQAVKILSTTGASHHVRFFCTLPGVFTNLLIVYVIWRSKDLHSKFFVHVASVALADWILCVSNVIIGIEVLFAIWFGTSTITTALVCMITAVGWSSIGQRATQISNLIMALDRFIAIQWPIFYQSMSWKYVALQQAICWLMAFATCFKSIIQTALQDGPIALCIYSQATRSDPIDVAFQSYLTYIIDAAIVVVLIATMASLLWLFKRRRLELTSMSTEIKAFWAVMVTCVYFLCSWAINQFSLIIIRDRNLVSPEQLPVASNYLQSAMLLYCSSTICIYLAMLSGFRQSFQYVICRRSRARVRVLPTEESRHNNEMMSQKTQARGV